MNVRETICVLPERNDDNFSSFSTVDKCVLCDFHFLGSTFNGRTCMTWRNLQDLNIRRCYVMVSLRSSWDLCGTLSLEPSWKTTRLSVWTRNHRNISTVKFAVCFKLHELRRWSSAHRLHVSTFVVNEPERDDRAVVSHFRRGPRTISGPHAKGRLNFESVQSIVTNSVAVHFGRTYLPRCGGRSGEHRKVPHKAAHTDRTHRIRGRINWVISWLRLHLRNWRPARGKSRDPIIFRRIPASSAHDRPMLSIMDAEYISPPLINLIPTYLCG